MTERRRPALRALDQNASVTPLELFFDLVFVFALTQVTAFMADHLSAEGLLRGLMIMALLWWSWTAYAWLDNVVPADEGLMRGVQFLGMAAMLLIALTVPEAFDDEPGGLSGPVVLAVSYFGFRVLHLLLFFIVARDDPTLRAQLVRFTPSVFASTAVLLIATRFDGGVQTALWAGALLADYLGTLLAGSSGWRLASPAHFAERHGLILIVALGESIVAIGVGVAQLPISWPIMAGAFLGLGVAAAQWWLYFDVTSLMAERALAATSGGERSAMARDAYTFAHMPLVAGVVLGALGLKKVLEYAGDTAHHDLGDPIKGTATFALYGGAVLYLLAHVYFTRRTTGVPAVSRIITAAGLVPLGFLMAGAPALLSLAALVAALLGLVVFETSHWAQIRAEVRGQAATEHE